MTIFLSCALRLSELASLNIDQVDNEVINVVGKGNKERRIYLTPAAKKSIYKWIKIRSSLDVPTDALFISRTAIE
ncbi:tyrosine-type recombinase/integrase [Desulfosporosinus fructosivorans]